MNLNNLCMYVMPQSIYSESIQNIYFFTAWYALRHLCIFTHIRKFKDCRGTHPNNQTVLTFPDVYTAGTSCQRPSVLNTRRRSVPVQRAVIMGNEQLPQTPSSLVVHMATVRCGLQHMGRVGPEGQSKRRKMRGGVLPGASPSYYRHSSSHNKHQVGSCMQRSTLPAKQNRLGTHHNSAHSQQ